ncbi:transposase [Haloplanus halophilus]|uniref:transposase n=1 Tax=Haloplanus halophilus TaxID=2949993 RepID=UPI00203FA1C3|nr:transposase [Haloplanus sp. GDY1]
MLKVLIFGYSIGVRSSRKLDRLLERDVVFRYLAANQQVVSHTTSGVYSKISASGYNYDKLTVNHCFRANMPPNGYTTVTISNETAAKLSRVMMRHDLESMALAIDHAAQCALDQEKMTNADLARLLHHRHQHEENQETA